MGTTESILYDNDEYEEDDDIMAEEGVVAAVPPSRPTSSHQRTTVMPQQQPQHSLRGLPEHDDRRIPAALRQPHRPSSASAKPPPSRLILHGCVLGLSKSGKSSLLERFQGREPKTKNSSKASSHNHSAQQQTAVAEPDHEETIEIPYKAPADAPTWHDRIRLHVKASKKVPSTTTSSKNVNEKEEDAATATDRIDFYILVIDPRCQPPQKKTTTKTKPTTAEKTQKYLTKVLRAAVKRQQRHDAPLCFCILRSFRDAISVDGDGDGDEDGNNAIQTADLTGWTLECLASLPDLTVVDSNQLLLQTFDVSLIDCYGLTQLHQFIYQSYAMYQIRQLQRQMEQAVMAQRTVVQPQPSYREFCRDHVATAGTPVENRSTTSSTKPGSRRAIMPQPPPAVEKQPNNLASKNALEAFLESDDEDSAVVHHTRKEECENDDDDDDESSEACTNGRPIEPVNQTDYGKDDAIARPQEHEVKSTRDPVQDEESDDENDQSASIKTVPPPPPQPQQSPKEELCAENHHSTAAGEPTADTSKPAAARIQESFFHDDDDDYTGDDDNDDNEKEGSSLNRDHHHHHPIAAAAAAPPDVASKKAVDSDGDADDDDDDDGAFFISQIDTDELEHEDVHNDNAKDVVQSIVPPSSSGSRRDQIEANEYNPEIQAAIAAARQDFQRMMLADSSKAPDSSKKPKKKKDPEKKRRKDQDKVKKATKD
jgi:hypothetical protein